MADERKYIYLEKIMKKVPIHAESGTYTWKIGDTSNGISEEMERLMVYAMYVGYPNYSFFELAKHNLSKKVFGDTSPELIRSSFKEDHPITDIVEYNYGMAEEFADAVKGMWVYGDKKQNFWITREDEKTLLSWLNDNTPWRNCKFRLRTISRRYDLNLDDKAVETALVNFLCQHGIDQNRIYNKDSVWESKRKLEVEEERKESLANMSYQEKQMSMTEDECWTQMDNAGLWERRILPLGSNGTFFIPRLGVARIMAILFMCIAVTLWVFLFCRNESIGLFAAEEWWAIPMFTLFTSLAAFHSDPDSMSGVKFWWVYTVFFLTSALASLTVFAIHWHGDFWDANICGAITAMVSIASLLLCFRTVAVGNGRGGHIYFNDPNEGGWRKMK